MLFNVPVTDGKNEAFHLANVSKRHHSQHVKLFYSTKFHLRNVTGLCIMV